MGKIKTGREQRRKVTNHLKNGMVKLPPAEQTQTRTTVLKDAMDKSLE